RMGGWGEVFAAPETRVTSHWVVADSNPATPLLNVFQDHPPINGHPRFSGRILQHAKTAFLASQTFSHAGIRKIARNPLCE
ncbi:MAG TPA: hypothetical protein VFG20_09690, partial [Planctomycetaceae bacterium]|nr:hypothetical protein [Planctomycetaceae bacterium]